MWLTVAVGWVRLLVFRKLRWRRNAPSNHDLDSRKPTALAVEGMRHKKISGQEKRFKRNTNHIISKKIVQSAQRHQKSIALEELHGFRKTVRKSQRERFDCEKLNRKSQSVFKCKSCKHSMNADLNAAINIAERALVNRLIAAEKSSSSKPTTLVVGN